MTGEGGGGRWLRNKTWWECVQSAWGLDVPVTRQVFAQASVVQDMSSPDLEAAVAALDEENGNNGDKTTAAAAAAIRATNSLKNAGQPPGGHATWTDWLRTVTDWDGTGGGGGGGGGGAGGAGGVVGGGGVDGRDVPVDEVWDGAG